MEYTPGSINKDSMNLDVEDIEKDHVQEESSKPLQQVTATSELLRSISTRQESAPETVHPFSSVDTVAVRCRTAGRQEYAMYRQKYLVTYSPFKSFEKKGMKKKINTWFALKLKRQNVKAETKTDELKSNDMSLKNCGTITKSSSAGFLERVLRLSWCGQWR